MDKTTTLVLRALSDCIQFDGYTQEISMIVRHKMSPDQRIKVLSEIDSLITEDPTKIL